MTLSFSQAKARVDAILSSFAAASVGQSSSLLSPSTTAGKLYEAWALSHVLLGLHHQEGFDVALVGSTKVTLKSSPGPINRSYPYFTLSRQGVPLFEVWTDVEFTAMSHSVRQATQTSAADYHELDIVVVPAGTAGRPSHATVALGVECKHTTFSKAMARAALGVRRELSLLTGWTNTAFKIWPRPRVPADPPSVLLVLSSDPGVAKHHDAGQVFGVDFVYLPM